VTPAELAILVQEGEGTTLEFKEGLSSSLARDLVAMANTIGGRILLGVRDDGSVAGVKDSNGLRGRVQDVEKSGTGIKHIRDEARGQGCPEPTIAETGFVSATFYPNPEVRAQAGAHGDMTPQVGTKSAPSRHQVTGEAAGEVTGEVTGEATPQVPRKYPASPSGTQRGGRSRLHARGASGGSRD